MRWKQEIEPRSRREEITGQYYHQVKIRRRQSACEFLLSFKNFLGARAVSNGVIRIRRTRASNSTAPSFPFLALPPLTTFSGTGSWQTLYHLSAPSLCILCSSWAAVAVRASHGLRSLHSGASRHFEERKMVELKETLSRVEDSLTHHLLNWVHWRRWWDSLPSK